MSVTTWKVLDDRFLITEDKNSAVNHKIPGPVIIKQEPDPQQRTDPTEDPESRPIKEEYVEQVIVQDEGRLVVKQETNSFMVSPAYQEVFLNGPDLQQMMETKAEPEPVCINEEHEDLCSDQDGEQLVIRAPDCEQQDIHDMDPNVDQLLSTNCPDAENQHQQVCHQKDLGSSEDEGLAPKRRHQGRINHKDNVENSKVKKSKANLPCCKVCGKCFAKRKYVTVHMRTHTGEKPYSCTFCGKAFIDHSTRARHTRTHTGVKPYPCELCDKSFTQPNHLAHHLRTHTGEKPFSCLTCGKDFTQQSNLTVHMRTHTGEKPYYCELCEKSFIQPSGLTRHLRTHTGEKPFSCLTCGKGFIQQSNLRVHMRTHTGKKPRFTD